MNKRFIKSPETQKKIVEFFKPANKSLLSKPFHREINLDDSIIDLSSDDESENVARKKKIAKRRNILKSPEKKRTRNSYADKKESKKQINLQLKKYDKTVMDKSFEIDKNSDIKIFTSTQTNSQHAEFSGGSKNKENHGNLKLVGNKSESSSTLREISPNNNQNKTENVEEFKHSCLNNDLMNVSLSDSMNDVFQDDLGLDEFQEEELLNLETWNKCTILNVNIINFNISIKVQSELSTAKATCILKQTWAQIKLEVAQTVNIIAKKTIDGYEINNEYGFLILSPNMLITGTALMGFMFCNRKSILDYTYGGRNSSNKVMTCGFLIHELLQETLKRKLCSVIDIKNLCHELIHRKDTISKLYDVEMGTTEALNEIQPFAEKITNFVQTYINMPANPSNTSLQRKSGNWQGYITKIHDIEENLWCPRLGLKGKIDISVEVMMNLKLKQQISPTSQIIPLELKTGRASMSPEHQGQVALYNMMLRELGFDSPTGLLLYLREDIIKEVELTRREERDLIILRNHLVSYLNKKPQTQRIDNSKLNNMPKPIKTTVMLPELPKPLNNKRMCENCEQLVLCSFLQSKSIEDCIDVSNNRKRDELYNEKINHLTQQHLQYFKHWIQAIRIEICTKILNKPTSDIWEYTPLERENKGKSLSNLIVKNIEFENGLYNTLFVTNKKTKKRNFLTSELVEGNYLIVSCTDRISIAAGFVINITQVSIMLALERNLNDRYSEYEFCIDAYNIQSNDTMYLTSLSLLMNDNDNCKRLREIIIERKTPIYSKVVSKKIINSSADILKNLNQMQQKAIYRVFTTQNYLLINGMPGTGKTQTLVVLIEILCMLKKSVLITSHTHSAVDNVLGKLLESKRIDPKTIIKIGSELRTSSTVKSRCENNLIKNCKTVEELETLYNSFGIVGLTCFGAYHPLLERKKFDICIVDESTQILQSIVIKPLMSAKIFILVGDPEQLPPIVQNDYAKEMGMQESLFERLFDSDCTEHLTLQYRMNKTINSLANKLTYKGKLMCGNTSVAESCLTFIKSIDIIEDWIRSICDSGINNAVKFIDTGNTIELNNQYFEKFQLNNSELFKPDDFKINKLSNICEAAIILQIVKSFLNAGLNINDIGIIAPFQAQIKLLKIVMKNIQMIHQKEEIEINTVDQFQGRDKKIIIFSCTKTNITHENCILADKRRLNVAVTRAKHKLILIGYKDAMMAYKSFENLFTSLEMHQYKILIDNEDQFSWNSVLEQLSNEITT